ncbi:MAG: hypothetical protein WC050_03500 [Candidatus Paceibacterota bacterium]
MTDLQFENQTNEFGRPPEASSGTDITGKIVQWGLASNREQAQYVLIAVAIAALIIAFFVYSRSSGSGAVEQSPFLQNTGQQ